MAAVDTSMGLTDFRKNLDAVRAQLQELTGLTVGRRTHPLTEWLVRAEKNYMAGKKRLGCAQAAYAKFASEDLQKAKLLYYDMMGWTEQGVPKQSKLDELDISWASDKISA